MYAIAGTGTLQVAVVVGISEIGLQQVVVYILGGEIDPDPVQPQRLELEHRHGSGGVLQQGMINFQGYFFAWLKPACNTVRFYDLVRKINPHIELLVNYRFRFSC
jgi:hypothetical protein